MKNEEECKHAIFPGRVANTSILGEDFLFLSFKMFHLKINMYSHDSLRCILGRKIQDLQLR